MKLKNFSKILELKASDISPGKFIKSWQNHIKKERYAAHAVAEAASLLKSIFIRKNGSDYLIDFDDVKVENFEKKMKLIDEIAPGSLEKLVSSSFVDISSSTSFSEQLEVEHDFFSKKHEILPMSFFINLLPKGLLWKKWCEFLVQKANDSKEQKEIFEKAVLERFALPKNGGILKLCMAACSSTETPSEVEIKSISTLDWMMIVLKIHNSPANSKLNKPAVELLDVCSESVHMDSEHWLLIDKLAPKHLEPKIEAVKERYFLSKTLDKNDVETKKEKGIDGNSGEEFKFTDMRRVRAL